MVNCIKQERAMPIKNRATTNIKSTVKKPKIQQRKPRTSNKKVTTSNRKPIIAIAIIVIFGVIGSILIFSSKAATSNFEAESAKRSSGISVSSDNMASGGKYVTFNSATPVSYNQLQRFPGDPNPRVTGKAYWGAAIGGNGDPARHEKPTGKSLSVRRTYYGWSNRQKMVDTARSDIAANRLPFVSTKTPAGWQDIYSGKRDAEIDDLLRKLDNLGGPVWLTVHHEPEGGGGGGKGPKGEDDVTGAAGWIKMQRKFRERMDVVGTKNIAFVANLMTWTWDKRSGRNPNDWWADNVWDVYTANSYCDESKGKCDNGGENAVSTTMWKNFEKFAQSKNIPYGTGEWGDRGSAAGAGDDIRKVWNHGFEDKSDLVVWAYFDSDLNSPNGGWTLNGSALTAFQEILKDDARVQRIKDLSNSSKTTTNYGTLNQEIEVPTSGNYKAWVRIMTPSSTANSMHVQIDNGPVETFGGKAINANSWTWVDYKNGDSSNKTIQSLSEGTHTVKITGIDRGVKLDRVLISNETCTPVGFGNNCANTTSTPEREPGKPYPAAAVTISSPANRSTVSGTVTVKSGATFPTQEVSFRIDNTWQATDKSSPFEWKWDTTKFSNGSHRVVTRTRAKGDPGNIYTEQYVTVIVNNR